MSLQHVCSIGLCHWVMNGVGGKFGLCSIVGSYTDWYWHIVLQGVIRSTGGSMSSR